MTSLYCHGFPPIFFWFKVWSDSATQTNYTSKYSNFQKKLIDTITTSNFYLKFKENNENDMAAQVFWAVFYSSRRPSQIGPTADFDSAAIPPTIFSMAWNIQILFTLAISNNSGLSSSESLYCSLSSTLLIKKPFAEAYFIGPEIADVHNRNGK